MRSTGELPGSEVIRPLRNVLNRTRMLIGNLADDLEMVSRRARWKIYLATPYNFLTRISSSFGKEV